MRLIRRFVGSPLEILFVARVAAGCSGDPRPGARRRLRGLEVGPRVDRAEGTGGQTSTGGGGTGGSRPPRWTRTRAPCRTRAAARAGCERSRSGGRRLGRGCQRHADGQRRRRPPAELHGRDSDLLRPPGGPHRRDAMPRRPDRGLDRVQGFLQRPAPAQRADQHPLQHHRAASTTSGCFPTTPPTARPPTDGTRAPRPATAGPPTRATGREFPERQPDVQRRHAHRAQRRRLGHHADSHHRRRRWTDRPSRPEQRRHGQQRQPDRGPGQQRARRHGRQVVQLQGLARRRDPGSEDLHQQLPQDRPTRAPRGDGNFYFKHGVYFCKTSAKGCFSHYKNIHLYKK